MSDTAIKDQPEAAPAVALEGQPTQESTTAAETSEENAVMADATTEAQNGAADEAQPAQETAPAAETSEQNTEEADAASQAKNGAADEKTDAAAEAQNGAEKKASDMLKTKGQIDRQDFKKNRKYDPSTQPVTDDPVKIRNQVCAFTCWTPA